MTRPAYSDRRPALSIACETWDREGGDGRERLVREAALLGYRLVVVEADWREWVPPSDPAEW